MILVTLTAVLAVCGAAKLDRNYLPPLTAKTAGGNPGDLLAPVEGLPSGSYTNDAQGVVVDAATPGTRNSGAEPTGLGGPRTSYGSTDSKVGAAAFKGSLFGFGNNGGSSTRIAPGFESIIGIKENVGGPNIRIAPGFNSIVASQGSETDKTRVNTLKFTNEIGLENYSYGYETDNGISVGENGVSVDGINANGGYSYKGDDGKVYSVSYTADKDGYKPYGSHLPTPPPIPYEIVKSLEQNAKEEAAGIVDDGTYNPQKYNGAGGYPSNKGDYNKNGPYMTTEDTKTGGSFVTNKPNLGAYGVGSYHSGTGTSAGPQRFKDKHVSLNVKEQNIQEGASIIKQRPSISTQGDQVALNQKGQFASNPQFGEGNSAFSSAFTSGSGSASAFASTGEVETDLRNAYMFDFHGAGLIPNSKSPASSASASASNNQPGLSSLLFSSKPEDNNFPTASGQSQFSNSNTQISGIQSTQHNFGVSSVATPTKVSPSPTQPSVSTHQVSHLGSTFGSNTGQYKPFTAQSSFTQTGSQAAGIPSSTSKPALALQPSSDGSYFYKPGNLFVTPTSTIENTKFPASPVTGSLSSSGSTQSEQNQGSTASFYNNEITQASISQFPSAVPTPTEVIPLSSRFGPKPTTQTGTSSSSSQFDATGNQPNFPHKPTIYFNQLSSQSNSTPKPSQPGTIYEYNKPTAFKDTPNRTNLQNKPGQASFEYKDSQSSNYQSKPSDSSSSLLNQFGQNRFGTIQSGSTFQEEKPIAPAHSTFQQTQFVSSEPFTGQIGQQNQGTLYEYNKPISQSSKFSQESTSIAGISNQNTQLGNKHFGSSQSSNYQSKPSDSSSSLLNQSGQNPFGTLQSGSTFQEEKPIAPAHSTFQQTQFGSSEPFTSQSVGQIGEQNQGTLYEYNKPISQSSKFSQESSSIAGISNQNPQLGNKYFGSSQASASFEQSQTPENIFSFQPTTQFIQKPQSLQVAGFSGSQTGSTSQQNHFGFLSGSQLSQKVQSTQGSSFASTDQSTQFGKKPLDANIQQTQTGSHSSTQFAHKPQTSQITHSGQTFGSQPTISFGQKPQKNQGINYSSSQIGSTFQQTPFGLTYGSQFGQKPQPVGTVSATASQIQPYSQIDNKPIGSESTQSTSPEAQFGLSSGSQFGLKQQDSSFATSSVSQGQNLQQAQLGTSFPTRFGEPSQVGLNPVNSQTGSTFQQAQYIDQKPLSIPSTSFTFNTSPNGPSTQSNQFGQKPLDSSSPQFNSSPGSLFVQKQSQGPGLPSDSASKTGSFFVQKPSSTAQIGTDFQETTFKTSTGFQYGQKPQSTFESNSKDQAAQTIQFSQQNFDSSHTTSKFGISTGLNVDQKQQTNQGTKVTSSTISQSTVPLNKNSFGHTQISPSLHQAAFGSSTGTQFGKKSETTQPLTSENKYKGQSPQSTQSNLNAFGSAQNKASSISQSQVDSITGSLFNQNPQPIGAVSQTIIPFGQNTAGVSHTGFGHQQSHGFITGSHFYQTPQYTQGTSFTSNPVSRGPTVQAIQFSQKPLNFSPVVGSSILQSQYGGNSQKPHSDIRTTSSITPQVQPISQYGNNPFSTQTTKNAFQQNHIGLSTGSQFIQNTDSHSESVQALDQQPHSSSQTKSESFSGSASQFGTQFGLKPFASTTQTNKVFGTTQTPVLTRFGSSTKQKPLKPASVFSSSSTSFEGTQTKYQTPTFGIVETQTQKPLGNSLSHIAQHQTTQLSNQFGTQSTVQHTDTSLKSQNNQLHIGQAFSTVSPLVSSSTRFGVKPNNPVNQVSADVFKTHSTPSTQISIEQLQQSAASKTQFGVSPTQTTIVTSQQPSQSPVSYSGHILKPNVFGNTQSTSSPFTVGLNHAKDSSNDRFSVSTVQTPIFGTIDSKLSNSRVVLIEKGEEFGGPREPPRYDSKTGYYY